MSEKHLEGDTPFNMAMLFYMALNKVWEAKDLAIIEGELMKWYLCLNAIKNRISFKIKDSKKLNKLFEEALEEIQKLPLENIKDSMDSDAVKKLNEIDIELIRVLNVNKMIFPNISVAHGLEKINSRYNLEKKKKNG